MIRVQVAHAAGLFGSALAALLREEADFDVSSGPADPLDEDPGWAEVWVTDAEELLPAPAPASLRVLPGLPGLPGLPVLSHLQPTRSASSTRSAPSTRAASSTRPVSSARSASSSRPAPSACSAPPAPAPAGPVGPRIPKGAGLLVLAEAHRPGVLRRAFDAGALGYVDKKGRAERLAEGVRAVARGERYVDVSLAVGLLRATEIPLTPRELGVLSLAAEGACVEEIALALHLSRGTVRNYLAASIRKTGARNRVDAIRIARGAGWV